MGDRDERHVDCTDLHDAGDDVPLDDEWRTEAEQDVSHSIGGDSWGEEDMEEDYEDEDNNEGGDTDRDEDDEDAGDSYQWAKPDEARMLENLKSLEELLRRVALVQQRRGRRGGESTAGDPPPQDGLSDADIERMLIEGGIGIGDEGSSSSSSGGSSLLKRQQSANEAAAAATPAAISSIQKELADITSSFVDPQAVVFERSASRATEKAPERAAAARFVQSLLFSTLDDQVALW